MNKQLLLHILEASMLHPVPLLRSLGVVETVQAAYKISGDPAYALKRYALADQFFLALHFYPHTAWFRSLCCMLFGVTRFSRLLAFTLRMTSFS